MRTLICYSEPKEMVFSKCKGRCQFYLILISYGPTIFASCWKGIKKPEGLRSGVGRTGRDIRSDLCFVKDKLFCLHFQPSRKARDNLGQDAEIKRDACMQTCICTARTLLSWLSILR